MCHDITYLHKVSILSNRGNPNGLLHERVGQNSNQNGNDQEVTDEQEQRQKGFAKHVEVAPNIPSGGSKAHHHLEQSIRRVGRSKILLEGQSECYKETAAADDNEQQNCE